MADYQKMYAVLCGAIDDVLDGLRTIPLAQPYARQLYSALLDAEDIYIDTTFYTCSSLARPYCSGVPSRLLCSLTATR